MIILTITLAVIASYLLFYSFYWFALTVAGSRLNDKKSKPNDKSPELLLVLPAYQPGPSFYKVLDAVETVIQSRDANVLVLLQEADDCFYSYAEKKGFMVIKKTFGHLGGNSYQHALRFIAELIEQKRAEKFWDPDFAMLIDKDNIISPDFLQNITPAQFDSYDVIQGKRCALETETSIAFFDGLTEKLNDTLYRTAKGSLGLMMEISGSGALIETDLFIRFIQKLDPKAPGFDKNFMVQLLNEKRKVKAIFLPACKLWEEKTATVEAHNPQRLRWFGEQYYNALYHAKTLVRSAFRNRRFASFDYLVTLCRPPRSIQVLVTPVLGLIEMATFLWTGKWIAGLPLFTVSTLLLMSAVALFLITNKVLVKTFRYSQGLFSLAFHNFFNAARSIQKKNQGTFIHTTHKL